MGLRGVSGPSQGESPLGENGTLGDSLLESKDSLYRLCALDNDRNGPAHRVTDR